VSEKEEFYALSLGLWQDLQDLIMIEDSLRYKNPKRKKQINEFMDECHEEAMEKYENIMEADLTLDQVEKEMQKLIKNYPYYFDPYRSLMDIYLEKEDYHKMEEIARKGYKKALSRIVDQKGRWPKSISWHYMENRHLVRMLDRFASELWEDGRALYAIEIYRKLLRSNPGDNIGARYNILAINLGFQFGEAEDDFPANHPGYVDAFKMDDWFQKNALDFPDEFEWWFEYEKKNNQ
jgi:tetratricopeptide (TPR) repeat protein